MGEGKIINKTEYPITRQQMIRDLKTLGIKTGDVLLVHSSLSSIGWVCGGAVSVIEALVESVGQNGTLIMPAHSGDLSDPAQWENPPVPKTWLNSIYEHMPIFEKEKTPTRGMGRISEIFRRYPKVIRSNHPQVSFCALGQKANEILKDHPLTPQFGKESPLGKLYNLNAKVLLLGVDYDSCTSFHLAECLSSEMGMKRYGTPQRINGKREWVWFDDYDYDSEDFNNIGSAFELEHHVKLGKVGQSESRLFHIKPAVSFAYRYLKNNRF